MINYKLFGNTFLHLVSKLNIMAFSVVISWGDGRKYENTVQFKTDWSASLGTWYYFSFSSGYDFTVIKSRQRRNCYSLFKNLLLKSPGKHKPQSTTLLKERLWHTCLPVNFAKCLPFFKEHLWWLLHITVLFLHFTEMLF